MREAKIRAVRYKGNICEDCGNTYPPYIFDFHHLNPKEKLFDCSGAVLKRNWDLIVEEIDKCVLLCSNCHRERHWGTKHSNSN